MFEAQIEVFVAPL